MPLLDFFLDKVLKKAYTICILPKKERKAQKWTQDEVVGKRAKQFPYGAFLAVFACLFRSKTKS